jgi:hypothetical protein
MSHFESEQQVGTPSNIGGREVLGAWILVGVLFVTMKSGSLISAVESGILEKNPSHTEIVMES